MSDSIVAEPNDEKTQPAAPEKQESETTNTADEETKNASGEDDDNDAEMGWKTREQSSLEDPTKSPLDESATITTNDSPQKTAGAESADVDAKMHESSDQPDDEDTKMSEETAPANEAEQTATTQASLPSESASGTPIEKEGEPEPMDVDDDDDDGVKENAHPTSAHPVDNDSANIVTTNVVDPDQSNGNVLPLRESVVPSSSSPPSARPNSAMSNTVSNPNARTSSSPALSRRTDASSIVSATTLPLNRNWTQVEERLLALLVLRRDSTFKIRNDPSICQDFMDYELETIPRNRRYHRTHNALICHWSGPTSRDVNTQAEALLHEEVELMRRGKMRCLKHTNAHVQSASDLTAVPSEVIELLMPNIHQYRRAVIANRLRSPRANPLGVKFDQAANEWIAFCPDEGSPINEFDSQEEAAKCYDNHVRNKYGFAVDTNYPLPLVLRLHLQWELEEASSMAELRMLYMRHYVSDFAVVNREEMAEVCNTTTQALEALRKNDKAAIRSQINERDLRSGLIGIIRVICTSNITVLRPDRVTPFDGHAFILTQSGFPLSVDDTAPIKAASSPPRRSKTKTSRESSASNTSTVDLTTCRQFLEWLMSQEELEPFLHPVDTVAYPSYLQMIKRPIDLGTMKKGLAKGLYKDVNAFVKDLLLMWDNCRAFNSSATHPLNRIAKKYAELTSKKLASYFDETTNRRSRRLQGKSGPRDGKGNGRSRAARRATKHECNGCRAPFATADSLRMHRRNCKFLKDKKCGCGYIATDANDLKHHQMTCELVETQRNGGKLDMRTLPKGTGLKIFWKQKCVWLDGVIESHIRDHTYKLLIDGDYVEFNLELVNFRLQTFPMHVDPELYMTPLMKKNRARTQAAEAEAAAAANTPPSNPTIAAATSTDSRRRHLTAFTLPDGRTKRPRAAEPTNVHLSSSANARPSSSTIGIKRPISDAVNNEFMLTNHKKRRVEPAATAPSPASSVSTSVPFAGGGGDDRSFGGDGGKSRSAGERSDSGHRRNDQDTGNSNVPVMDLNRMFNVSEGAIDARRRNEQFAQHVHEYASFKSWWNSHQKEDQAFWDKFRAKFG